MAGGPYSAEPLLRCLCKITHRPAAAAVGTVNGSASSKKQQNATSSLGGRTGAQPPMGLGLGWIETSFMVRVLDGM